jgi:hypothetical protein
VWRGGGYQATPQRPPGFQVELSQVEQATGSNSREMQVWTSTFSTEKRSSDSISATASSDPNTSNVVLMHSCQRECCFGTQFSNLYTAVDSPARGRVGVCVVFVCLVFTCKYVFRHSRVSHPLNLRLCLLRHLGFLTSSYASPTCSRRRLNSYRLLRCFTPDPPPIPWAYPLYLPASPRPPLYTSAMTTELTTVEKNLIKGTNQRESRTQPSFHTLPLNTI